MDRLYGSKCPNRAGDYQEKKKNASETEPRSFGGGFVRSRRATERRRRKRTLPIQHIRRFAGEPPGTASDAGLLRRYLDRRERAASPALKRAT